MKKFNFFKIASLALVCVMLLGAFMFTTFAEDGTDASTVEIVSNNVYYGDKLQIMYAIKAPEGATMTAVDTEGNEINVIPFTDDEGNTTIKIGETEYPMYILETGVSVQAIDEKITLTVTANNGDKAVKTYSVVQYIYERSNKLKAAEQTEKVVNELAMLEALVDYANAANLFLDNDNTDFNNYKYVTVVDGTIDGNNTTGMFAPGATPFGNIETTLDYDNSTHNVEWSVSVDGAAAERYDDDAIKTLAVSGKSMTVTAVLVENAHTHTWDDGVVTTPATCTTEGVLTKTCTYDGCGETTTEVIEALGHTEVVDAAVAPTCSATGLTEGKHCSVCGEVLKAQEELAVVAHNYVDGTCEWCGATKATLTLSIKDYAAANGWSNSVQYSTINMNSSVTVVATTKGNNGKYYTSGYEWRLYQSDDGAITITTTAGNIISVKVTYTATNSGTLLLDGAKIASETVVAVDAKSVTFTVGNTGTATNGQAKVTAIEVVYGVEPHDCIYSEATCEQKATCTICGNTTGDFAEHTWVAATCKDPQTCSVCEKTQGDALGHTTENGTCERCGQVVGGDVEKMETTKYTFSNYTAGTQYAQGEEHELDANTKLIINGAHLNSQVRLYSGSSCVFEFAKAVDVITVKAGYKVGTLTVYVSDDGETWTKVKAISTTTSYTEYNVDLGGSYQYVKLESTGAQIRVSELTVNP